MFYCEECRKDRDWPTALAQSHGTCEMCNKTALCHDRPCSSLPMPVVDTSHITTMNKDQLLELLLDFHSGDDNEELTAIRARVGEFNIERCSNAIHFLANSYRFKYCPDCGTVL